MSSKASVILRRTGIAAAAVGGYATVVYFTLQFMAPEQQQPTNESNNTTTNNNNCCCHCYTSSPDRNNTYQKIAQVYDDQISRDEFVMGLPLLRRSLLYFHAKGEVLEVGAGTGRNLNYYPMNQVKDVVLTDVSDQMLLQARNKIVEKRKENENKWFGWNMLDYSIFKVFVADAISMTNYYKENKFDTIVSTFTLCSFDNPVEVLKELQSVCKDDGKILLLEHGRSKSYDGLSNYLDKYAERHAKNWGCVWNRDLDDIVEKAGLEIERLYTWHFGTTYYMVCRPSVKVKEERRRLRELKMLEQKEEDKSEGSGENKESGIKRWQKFVFMPFWKN